MVSLTPWRHELWDAWSTEQHFLRGKKEMWPYGIVRLLPILEKFKSVEEGVLESRKFVGNQVIKMGVVCGGGQNLFLKEENTSLSRTLEHQLNPSSIHLTHLSPIPVLLTRHLWAGTWGSVFCATRADLCEPCWKQIFPSSTFCLHLIDEKSEVPDRCH